MRNDKDGCKYVKHFQRLRGSDWLDWQLQCELFSLVRRIVRAVSRDVKMPVQSLVSDSDLFQESALRVLQKIGQFRGGSDREFVAWLWLVARSTLLNQARRLSFEKKVVRGCSLGEVAACNPDSQQESIRVERIVEVESVISVLPPRYEIAIRMRSEGKSYATIGEAIHSTANAARQVWLRARSLVRRRLACRDTPTDS